MARSRALWNETPGGVAGDLEWDGETGSRSVVGCRARGPVVSVGSVSEEGEGYDDAIGLPDGGIESVIIVGPHGMAGFCAQYK